MANSTTNPKVTDGTCTVTSSLGAPAPSTAEKGIQLYDLELLTQWGAEWQSDGSICYSNVNAPVSQKELIYFDSKSIPTVSNNLKLVSANQSAVKGVHYGVRHEECVITRKSDCDIPVYVDPIVSDIHIRHVNSSFITDEIVLEHFGKTLSALIMNGSTASTPKTRLAALMRGLKQVTAD